MTGGARSWSVDEVRALGVSTDLETLASIFGISRGLAYQAARAGDLDYCVRRIGTRYVVLVEPMLRELGLGPSIEPGTADTTTAGPDSKTPVPVLEPVPARSPRQGDLHHGRPTSPPRANTRLRGL